MYATGDYSKTAVLHQLKALGLKTRTGKELAAQSLNSMLKNPLYAGRVRVKRFGVDAQAAFEAVVPEDLFDRVQRVLVGKHPNSTPHRKLNPEFPLRRFVRCGHCGTPLTGGRSTGRNQTYPYYHCHSCGQVRVRKEQLEESFLELLRNLKPSEPYMELFRAVILDVWEERQTDARKVADDLRRRTDDLRHRVDLLEEAFIFRKAIDQESYTRQRDMLREELALASIDAQHAELDQLDIEGVLAFARRLVSDAARLWEEATPEQQQRLQAAFFPEGLAYSDGNFKTAPMCLAFRQIGASDSEISSLASPAGVEPAFRP